MEARLPEFLIQMLEKQYGEELTKEIIEGYSQKRLTTLRANTLKTELNIVAEKLGQAGIETEKVLWSKEAFILKKAQEKKVQELPMYEAEEIYLQSLSSMLPPIILEPKQGNDILDMAAAPRR